MSVYYIASLKINYFIAQNLGNKAKPRDHNPPVYFRAPVQIFSISKNTCLV